MKSFRFALAVLVASLVTFAVAQDHSDMHTASAAAPQSDAAKSFALLKTFAGTWQGKITMVPEMPNMKDDGPLQISMRVTSRGNAIVHEMKGANAPDDPSKFDHPVTMLYLDADKVNLIHYCDAGNRPHMIARPSADGKSVEFDFADLSGPTKFGHMHHAVFTAVDANHHIEDWTYMMPGDKPMHAHFELVRLQ